jgi:hypothetical protein
VASASSTVVHSPGFDQAESAENDTRRGLLTTIGGAACALRTGAASRTLGAGTALAIAIGASIRAGPGSTGCHRDAEATSGALGAAGNRAAARGASVGFGAGTARFTGAALTGARFGARWLPD